MVTLTAAHSALNAHMLRGLWQSSIIIMSGRHKLHVKNESQVEQQKWSRDLFLKNIKRLVFPMGSFKSNSIQEQFYWKKEWLSHDPWCLVHLGLVSSLMHSCLSICLSSACIFCPLCFLNVFKKEIH